ncbi:MAG TPA: HAMP domain-containing sensor histidine kinase [Phnomibacter sp.]|nr:HAMP domain-containing sensor histidine kinase [Phnomibacter sp.]
MAIQRKLALITVGYWFLLLYIIAALIWWFIALNQQSTEMAALKLSQVHADDPALISKQKEVEDFKRRKVTQYSGEGAIFLLLILVGAVFVYRAVRKQLQLAQQQQNFMMAITHELKTPIAVTRLNIETLQKRKLDNEKQQQLLKIALAETDRLNDLTNNILLASRMEGGDAEHFSEKVDLSAISEDVLRQFRSRFPERKFNGKIDAECVVQGDPLLLRILISNLLDNAIKYSPAHTAVELRCVRSAIGHEIMVSDHGPGIPEEERKMVFEKFYRIGNEVTRSAKGTGLGLYLCDRITKAHHGAISIDDDRTVGCTFRVRLPAVMS